MQRPNYDFRDHYPEGSTTFTEYVEYTQPEIFERFEDTIRDISTA